MPDSIGRASVLTVLGSYLALPVAVVSGVLLARVAGPEVKGLYTIFTATQGFLILPAFAIQAALTRFVAHRRPSSRAIWPRIQWIIVAQTVISVGILGALLPLPSVRALIFSGLSAWYLIPVLIFVALNLWYLYRSAVVSGRQLYSKNAVTSYVGGLVSSLIFIAVLLVWWLKDISPGIQWIIGVALVGMAASVLVWRFATPEVESFEGSDVPGGPMTREMTDFAMPVLLRVVLEWANLRLDIYFVNAFVGAKALGVYTVAVGVSQQLWAIPFSVAMPLFSRVSRDGDTTASRETARFAFRIVVMMTLALAVVAGITAPFLIPFVYGSRFARATVLLLLLLPGVVAISPTRAVASYFTGIGRPSEPLIAEAVGLTATIVLNWILVPRYGARGAAVASSAAYIGFSGYLSVRFKIVSHSSWGDLLAIRRSDAVAVWKRLLELIPEPVKRVPASVMHNS